MSRASAGAVGALAAGVVAGALGLGLLVEEQSATGGTYDRAAFGNGWADTDRDGCDTRAEVLQRAMQREVVRDANGGGCLVLSGRLTDPYTRETGTVQASSLDVDHVVALSDAWASGASSWTPEQREAYANDPAVLVATDLGVNRSKGDRGPDEWTPPTPAAVCWYVTTYEEIKVTYDLEVTPAQQDAIDAGCGS